MGAIAVRRFDNAGWSDERGNDKRGRMVGGYESERLRASEVFGEA